MLKRGSWARIYKHVLFTFTPCAFPGSSPTSGFLPRGEKDLPRLTEGPPQKSRLDSELAAAPTSRVTLTPPPSKKNSNATPFWQRPSKAATAAPAGLHGSAVG